MTHQKRDSPAGTMSEVSEWATVTARAPRVSDNAAPPFTAAPRAQLDTWMAEDRQ